MKKTILFLAFLGLTMSAIAQRNPFAEGKWFINPSITGLDLSYSKNTKLHLGADIQTGAFIFDDFALLVNLGGEANKNDNRISAGVGFRYYFLGSGFYWGAGLNVDKWKRHSADFGANAEVGYAFFISRRITLEPSVYYKLNFDDNDLSRFGLKLGFGLYF